MSSVPVGGKVPLKVIVGFFVCNLVSKLGRDEVATKTSSLLL